MFVSRKLNNKVMESTVRKFFLKCCVFLLLPVTQDCAVNKHPTSKNPGKYSTATGSMYNDGEDGFKIDPYSGQLIPNGMVYIEGGMYLTGDLSGSIDGENNRVNTRARVTINSFYVDETVLCNIHYLEYLHFLKNNATKEEYKAALPDETVWESVFEFNDSFKKEYFYHPRYSFYPALPTFLQAEDYALFRTDKLNSNRAKRLGLDPPSSLWEKNRKNKKGKEGEAVPSVEPSQEPAAVVEDPSVNADGSVNENATPNENANTNETVGENVGDDLEEDELETGDKYSQLRLLTEAEWEFMAFGIPGTIDTDGVQKSQRVFPWDGLKLRGTEGIYKGKFLTAFKRGRGDYFGLPGESKVGMVAPYPVRSFPPNDNGVYLCDGVRELVFDLYRPLRVNCDSNPVRRDDTYDSVSTYDSQNSLINNDVMVVKGWSIKSGGAFIAVGKRSFQEKDKSASDVSVRFCFTSTILIDK